MATSVPVAHYRNEFIQGFEARESVFRKAVTTEAMSDGLTSTFLIVNTSREAVTRGPNGLIPAAVDDQSQVTVTLKEYHDLVQRTKFNIFTDQADQRAIMQQGGMSVINRSIDNEIITALQAATNTVSGATMNKTVVNKVLTKLGNGKVPRDDNLFAAVTPAVWAELTDITSFASQDYVTARPVEDGIPSPERFIRWMGFKWFVPDVDLPGQGTTTATCFFFHRNAIGHAVNKGMIEIAGGYNEEQSYYFARHSIFQGAKLLLNTGVVKITDHNDQTLSA